MSFAGTTCGAGDDGGPRCGAVAEEVVMRWVAPSDGTFVFDLSGSALPSTLQLGLDCTGPFTCDADGGAGGQAAQTRELSAGDVVTLLVEGEQACGSFELDIQDLAGCEDSLEPNDSLATAQPFVAGVALTLNDADDWFTHELPAYSTLRIDTLDDERLVTLFTSDGSAGGPTGRVATYTNPNPSPVIVTSRTIAAPGESPSCRSYTLEVGVELQQACVADVTAGSLAAVAGSTCGAGDDRVADCGPEGEEVTVSWTAPYSGRFVFDTSGSAVDTTVERSLDCSQASDLCDATGGAGSRGVVVVDLAGGETSTVYVSAETCGLYELDIQDLDACDDLLEPNDSISEATPWVATEPLSANDVDWFEVEVLANERRTLSLSEGMTATVYAQTGALLVAEASSVSIQDTLGADQTVLVRVRPDAGTALSCRPYTMSSLVEELEDCQDGIDNDGDTFTDCFDDNCRPACALECADVFGPDNQSPDGAVVLGTGVLNLSLSPLESDWFEVVVPPHHRATLTATPGLVTEDLQITTEVYGGPGGHPGGVSYLVPNDSGGPLPVLFSVERLALEDVCLPYVLQTELDPIADCSVVETAEPFDATSPATDLLATYQMSSLDEDAFSLTLPANSLVTLDVIPSTPAPTYYSTRVEVLDENGFLVTHTDVENLLIRPIVFRHPNPVVGHYTLVLQQRFYSACFDYTVDVSSVPDPCPNDVYEPNDVIENASGLVVAPELRFGTQDRDWFWIDLAPGETFSLASDSQLSVLIYDASFEFAGTEPFTAPAGGRYYLRVRWPFTGACFSETMMWSVN
jgi:hypothetical protein